MRGMLRELDLFWHFISQSHVTTLLGILASELVANAVAGTCAAAQCCSVATTGRYNFELIVEPLLANELGWCSEVLL